MDTEAIAENVVHTLSQSLNAATTLAVVYHDSSSTQLLTTNDVIRPSFTRPEHHGVKRMIGLLSTGMSDGKGLLTSSNDHSSMQKSGAGGFLKTPGTSFAHVMS